MRLVLCCVLCHPLALAVFGLRVSVSLGQAIGVVSSLEASVWDPGEEKGSVGRVIDILRVIASFKTRLVCFSVYYCCFLLF